MNKMNIKYATLFLSGLLFCFFLGSCKDSNNNNVDNSISNDAQIYSFAMVVPTPAAKDSLQKIYLDSLYKVVNKYKYAIDQKSGLIYNPDSLPFGTVLDTVAIALTFGSAGVQQVTVTTPDSINGYIWNLKDSINVSKMPVKFTPKAYSGQPKDYTLDIRIHKVDPDTIVWKKEASLPEAGKIKTLLKETEEKPDQPKKYEFYSYVLKNNQISLYTADAKSSLVWSKKTVSNLPQSINVSSITLLNGVFSCIDNNGGSYKSADGLSWEKVPNNKKLISILGVLPTNIKGKELLLVTINENGSYYFAKGESLTSLEKVENISGYVVSNAVPSNFPLEGAASTTNLSSNNSLNMLMLVGGQSPSGAKLAHTWLVKNLASGIEITPFMKSSPFAGGAGISSFLYNNLFYVLDTNQFYTSSSWGESWVKAPKKQRLDPNISKRNGESVIVDSENNIWIFGGVSDKGIYLNDVWKGRLNSLNP